MKKLSKILVLVLSLALLCGVFATLAFADPTEMGGTETISIDFQTGDFYYKLGDGASSEEGSYPGVMLGTNWKYGVVGIGSTFDGNRYFRWVADEAGHCEDAFGFFFMKTDNSHFELDNVGTFTVDYDLTTETIYFGQMGMFFNVRKADTTGAFGSGAIYVVSDESKANWYISNSNTSAGKTVSLGSAYDWHHVTWVVHMQEKRSTTTALVYIDGVYFDTVYDLMTDDAAYIECFRGGPAGVSGNPSVLGQTVCFDNFKVRSFPSSYTGAITTVTKDTDIAENTDCYWTDSYAYPKCESTVSVGTDGVVGEGGEPVLTKYATFADAVDAITDTATQYIVLTQDTKLERTKITKEVRVKTNGFAFNYNANGYYPDTETTAGEVIFILPDDFDVLTIHWMTDLNNPENYEVAKYAQTVVPAYFGTNLVETYFGEGKMHVFKGWADEDGNPVTFAAVNGDDAGTEVSYYPVYNETDVVAEILNTSGGHVEYLSTFTAFKSACQRTDGYEIKLLNDLYYKVDDNDANNFRVLSTSNYTNFVLNLNGFKIYKDQFNSTNGRYKSSFFCFYTKTDIVIKNGTIDFNSNDGQMVCMMNGGACRGSTVTFEDLTITCGGPFYRGCDKNTLTIDNVKCLRTRDTNYSCIYTGNENGTITNSTFTGTCGGSVALFTNNKSTKDTTENGTINVDNCEFNNTYANNYSLFPDDKSRGQAVTARQQVNFTNCKFNGSVSLTYNGVYAESGADYHFGAGNIFKTNDFDKSKIGDKFIMDFSASLVKYNVPMTTYYTDLTTGEQVAMNWTAGYTTTTDDKITTVIWANSVGSLQEEYAVGGTAKFEGTYNDIVTGNGIYNLGFSGNFEEDLTNLTAGDHEFTPIMNRSILLGVKYNLSLYTNFNVNLYVPKTDKLTGISYTEGGENVLATAPVVTIGGAQYYMLTVAVDADKIADDVAIYQTITDGANLYTGYTKANITKYATSVLTATDTTVFDKELMMDMLNYAQETYKLFGGKANAAIAAILADTTNAAYASKATVVPTSAADTTAIAGAIESAQLSLTAAPTFVFNIKEGFTGSVTVTYTNKKGDLVTKTENYTAAAAGTTLALDAMAVYDMLATLNITVTGDVAATGTYDLAAYANGTAVGGVVTAYAQALYTYATFANMYVR